MTEDEKYLFDLNGYLIVENVLTKDELALANEAVDRHLDKGRVRPREQRLDGDSPALEGTQVAANWANIHWDKPWMPIPF